MADRMTTNGEKHAPLWPAKTAYRLKNHPTHAVSTAVKYRQKTTILLYG